MPETWIGDEADDGAFTEVFWERHRSELEAGEFWAVRIKKLRSEPAERLALALENLPLPGAFREAAIAVRAIIRDLRKSGSSHDDQLRLLYWLAALDSFRVPRSDRLDEPGYNVMEYIPGKVLRALSFSYEDLGYKELQLLNSTDVKWFVERWGEPKSHTTLHRMHYDTWCIYEDKLFEKRQRDSEAFSESLGCEIIQESSPSTEGSVPVSNTKRSYALRSILKILVIGGACLLLMLLLMVAVLG